MSADSDRARLVDALYASLGIIPMWRGFLAAARAAFVCDEVLLLIEPGAGDLPTLFAEPETAGAVSTWPEGKQPIETGTNPHSLALAVAIDPPARAQLVLRRHQVRKFGEAPAALLAALAPDLRRAVRLYFQIALMQRRLVVSTTAIESASMGIVLADPDGTVMLTNAIADEILGKSDGLSVAHGRLKALAPADTATLLRHIAAKAAEQTAEVDWRNYEPMALPRPDHELPLTAIIRPGPAFHPARNPLRRTALLVLRDPERHPPMPTLAIGRLFGLTRAEALLASELGTGFSLEEAATRIGISRNTARAQLQSIFSKTGTNSQKELVRILMSSAATLSG
jgi:DNA-binding CsgD family transcriptional regulator/PAS domain-containing protein